MRSLRAGQVGITTLLFAAGVSIPVFTIARLGNRMTQSIAWAGLVKVSSKCFDNSSYGMIMGILSISYLLADAAAAQ
jgi:sugar phosphate permease